MRGRGRITVAAAADAVSHHFDFDAAFQGFFLRENSCGLGGCICAYIGIFYIRQVHGMYVPLAPAAAAAASDAAAAPPTRRGAVRGEAPLLTRNSTWRSKRMPLMSAIASCNVALWMHVCP